MVDRKTRFVMVGGFLGAGKTTTLARLARFYVERGLRVGLVTNDQAFDLVDTRMLRSQGFRVGEVPGACFCCKFDELMQTLARQGADEAPDVVITEPVGSCTDLVATVIEPLQQLHGDLYEIAPLAVLLKPEHGQKILRNEPGSGFSPKAEYIFLKQLEEAEVMVVNKVDKLTMDQRQELHGLLQERFPGKKILFFSARDGDGLEALAECLSAKHRTSSLMDVDYDTYAEGEAELGWLNATHHLKLEQAASLDLFVMRFVQLVHEQLLDQSLEAAHLKALAESGETAALANLVGTHVDVELSVPSGASQSEIDLVVNARAVASPEQLRGCIEAAVSNLLSEFPGTAKTIREQSFRPGRPVPTHRAGASG